MSRARSALVVVLAIVVWSQSPVAEENWHPPTGIPAPSFGIREAAPAAPNPWTGPVPGFYYVNPGDSRADDLSNEYGYPNRPRRTIPKPLPAGSVVELHGTYSTAHTSPAGIVAEGTSAKPVFIRGASASDRPRITSCWEVSGSYIVIEMVEFAECGSVVILAPADHAALRQSDVHGNLGGGGVGVQSWNSNNVSDIVIYGNLIHDNGDVKASYDQDVHGIAVGRNVSQLWVVDNKLYRNSGDGIQINAGNAGSQATTHHIYVGRNQAFQNKQSGFWVKQAVDVILSENVSFNHRPSNSSPGACMGAQYAPEYIWFVNNQMWDCDYGIQIASDSNQGVGKAQFIVGNVIARIHDSDGGFNPDSAWHNCGISLPGGIYRYVIENSLWDVDSGICVVYAQGVVFFYDNAIQGVRSNGYHVFAESAALANASRGARANLFAPNYRLRIGSAVSIYPPGTTGINAVVSDIGWAGAGSGNFQLKADSPAVNAGVAHKLGLWEHFRSRYGTNIDVDVYGTRRPVGDSSDVGATERP